MGIKTTYLEDWLVLVLVVRMVRTEPYMQVSHFWDLAAHPRGMHPFNPVMLGIGREEGSYHIRAVI